MAFNNIYSMNYPYQIPQQPNNSGFIWVQGEAGAKSYLIAPNNTVPLWDSEAQTIYLKSADASGMPSMKILDYTVREVNISSKTPLVIPDKEYVTKEELNALRAEISAKIDSLTEEADNE